MDIGKQIIDTRIRKIQEEHPEWMQGQPTEGHKLSRAFLILAVSCYLEREPGEVLEYLTDGGNDCGIDALYLEGTENMSFDIVLFQAKYRQDLEKEFAFPANAIGQVIESIRLLTDPSRQARMNPELQSRYNEIQSLIWDGYIPYIHVVTLSNGDTWNEEGEQHIKNAAFPENQVSFSHFNHNDILNYMKRMDSITTQLHMVGKSISEEFNYKRVLLGKMKIQEIAALMQKYGNRLLEKNIRHYLGLYHNKVNEGIRETLLGERRNNFFFYNNGITFVCRKFSANALQAENWIVQTEDLQVINGGQTCRTIASTLREYPEEDFSNSYVLIRLYELEEREDIISEITRATNSQNPVDFRDLRSNEEEQQLLELAMKDLGYVYKRKRESVVLSRGRTISSLVAAEAVFAIWRQKPHLAKYHKQEMFDSYYEEIFQDLNAAQLVIAVLIYRSCDAKRKQEQENENVMAHLPYSQYFIAMKCGQLLLQQAGISLNQLTHRRFEEIRRLWEEKQEDLYQAGVGIMTQVLQEHFHIERLTELDGRSMAAVFRRYDLIWKILEK